MRHKMYLSNYDLYITLQKAKFWLLFTFRILISHYSPIEKIINSLKILRYQ